jgi:hypothetical protein
MITEVPWAYALQVMAFSDPILAGRTSGAAIIIVSTLNLGFDYHKCRYAPSTATPTVASTPTSATAAAT